MTVPQELLGTIPGWITSAGVVAILGLVVRWQLGLRTLGVKDDADIRDHYAQELSALREKLNRQEQHFMGLETHWREMLQASDRRHEECEAARQAMRIELGGMHDELAGLKRQIAHYSANQLVILQDRHPSDAAPEASASAPRVRKIIEDGDK